ncbi:MAG: GTP cyclohydrolase I [Proteobacteria bacterium]|nr:GTP cyclohydrolase I [Pseudomonadota bacterium]
MNKDALIKSTELIIDALGVDKKDENFKETPIRVAKSYTEMLSGLEDIEQQLATIFSKSFPSSYTGMVIVKDVHCYSMCPHHLLAVDYNVAFGYIPNNRMIGLSKIPRAISVMAKTPTIQETFTHNIIQLIDEHLKPKGSICVVFGKHLCMRCRGIKQENSVAITSDFSGVFEETATRNEFFTLLNTK